MVHHKIGKIPENDIQSESDLERTVNDFDRVLAVACKLSCPIRYSKKNHLGGSADSYRTQELNRAIV